MNAYSTSDSPCGPLFSIDARGVSNDIAMPGADQHDQRHGQDVERDQLDLAGGDLLAEVLRRAADHQAGDEDRHDRQHEHAVEAGADAAGRDLAEAHVEDQQRRRRRR